MTRIYGFTPSWWIVMIFVGGFSILIGISSIINNFPDAIKGKFNFFDYLGLLTIVPMLILFGILAILTLICSKIVITETVLEYHTLVSIYYSDWRDLQYSGRIRQGFAGDATVLFSTNPKIKVRVWAKRLPWDVEKSTILRGIPISWFGGLNGNKLRSEIAVYAPHLLRSP